jgi:hypothetical protein
MIAFCNFANALKIVAQWICMDWRLFSDVDCGNSRCLHDWVCLLCENCEKTEKNIFLFSAGDATLTQLRTCKVILRTKAFYSLEAMRIHDSPTEVPPESRLSNVLSGCSSRCAGPMIFRRVCSDFETFCLGGARRAEQVTMHIRRHTERHPTSGMGVVGLVERDLQCG